MAKKLPTKNATAGRPINADSEKRKKEIIKAAVKVMGTQGYRNLTMSEVAHQAGLSPTGLAHYFKSRDRLLTAVLDYRDVKDSKAVERVAQKERGESRLTGWAAIESLADLIKHNAKQPGMIRLFTTLSGEAVSQDHPANAWLQRHHARFKEQLKHHFETAIADGKLVEETPVDELIHTIIATMDGLQVQWLVQPGGDAGQLDMAGVFQQLVATIERAWGR